jgi:hypothetical protein
MAADASSYPFRKERSSRIGGPSGRRSLMIADEHSQKGSPQLRLHFLKIRGEAQIPIQMREYLLK